MPCWLSILASLVNEGSQEENPLIQLTGVDLLDCAVRGCVWKGLLNFPTIHPATGIRGGNLKKFSGSETAASSWTGGRQCCFGQQAREVIGTKVGRRTFQLENMDARTNLFL